MFYLLDFPDDLAESLCGLLVILANELGSLLEKVEQSYVDYVMLCGRLDGAAPSRSPVIGVRLKLADVWRAL